MNIPIRKLFPALILSFGLAACGGGGGDDDDTTDSGFTAVRGHFQQDGLWLLEAEITVNSEQTVSSGTGETVTGQATFTMNMVTQQVVDYTDDNQIAIKSCDATEPVEVMSLNEIEQEQYFSSDEDFEDYCPSETHSFEAVSDDQFRIQVRCGSKLSATINVTRISDTPEFNAGSLNFTKMDGESNELPPLNASSGVCGNIMRVSGSVDFPDGNALGQPDIDIKLTDVEIGVLDYLGEPLVLEMSFGFNPVEPGDYSVAFGTNANIVSIRMEEAASGALLAGNGGLVSVTEVLDDAMTGTFDMTLIQLEDAPAGPLPSYNYVGSFDLDLDPR